MEHYIVKERMRKIRTRLYRQRVRDYHSQILSDNRPLYHHALSYTLDSARSGDRFSGSPLSSASPDRISRVSGKILYARESTRSLTLSLGKGSEVCCVAIGHNASFSVHIRFLCVCFVLFWLCFVFKLTSGFRTIGFGR